MLGSVDAFFGSFVGVSSENFFEISGVPMGTVPCFPDVVDHGLEEALVDGVSEDSVGLLQRVEELSGETIETIDSRFVISSS